MPVEKIVEIDLEKVRSSDGETATAEVEVDFEKIAGSMAAVSTAH